MNKSMNKVSKMRFAHFFKNHHYGCNYNLGHDILELYNVLVRIGLTTSKTKRDIQYSKPGIQLAERLKTDDSGNKEILGKCQIWVETQPSAKSSSQKPNSGNSNQKTRDVKVDIKVFLSYQVLLDFSILFQIP